MRRRFTRSPGSDVPVADGNPDSLRCGYDTKALPYATQMVFHGALRKVERDSNLGLTPPGSYPGQDLPLARGEPADGLVGWSFQQAPRSEKSGDRYDR